MQKGGVGRPKLLKNAVLALMFMTADVSKPSFYPLPTMTSSIFMPYSLAHAVQYLSCMLSSWHLWRRTNKEMVRRNGRLTQSVGMQRNVYIMAYTFWQLSYSNRILPWLTEFSLLSWQAKQTALCQLCVSFSLPH